MKYVNNLAIIQARTGSSRLPNKVLKKICGKTLLELVINRVTAATTVEKVLVATTSKPEDDAIEVLCKSKEIDVYRGSENDVLDRYYQAACLYHPRNIIRITADCPLIDPELIDEIVNAHILANCDYTSNTLVETYPDGLDTEVMKFSALEKAWKTADLASEREHVTPYIKYKDGFTRKSIEITPSLAGKRWTVDTERDFEFVKNIYEGLYNNRSIFLTNDILLFLRDHPSLESINANIERNEGYKKSVKNDYIIK